MRSTNGAVEQTEIENAKKSAPEGVVPAYSYLKDWTPDYAATAEFELVVQKQHLPVHKHVMSMSPVFQRELFKTESKRSLLNASLKKKRDAPVETRMQLSSPMFMDVSVDDMCLLLSHIYATEATLSVERMDDVRKLFAMTEEFEFHSITRRCVNFVRNVENLAPGINTDLEKNQTSAASEWLELAIKWDFDVIKDEVCKYAGKDTPSTSTEATCVHHLGEHFLEIYGREKDVEPEKKWADLVMVLESKVDLWKRMARHQAIRIESGPSLASLISDEPSTTLIYGVLIGIFAGSILPSWMFFLLLCGTVWYIVHKMPPALLVVIQKTLEGAVSGILHGDSARTNASADVASQHTTTPTYKNKGKPPVLRRSTHVTA